MRTGRIEANLQVLNQEFNLSYVVDLISRKKEGREQERWFEERGLEERRTVVAGSE